MEKSGLRWLFELNEKGNRSFSNLARNRTVTESRLNPPGDHPGREIHARWNLHKAGLVITQPTTHIFALHAVQNINGSQYAYTANNNPAGRWRSGFLRRVDHTTETGISRCERAPDDIVRKLVPQPTQECIPWLHVLKLLVPQCLKPPPLGACLLLEKKILARVPVFLGHRQQSLFRESHFLGPREVGAPKTTGIDFELQIEGTREPTIAALIRKPYAAMKLRHNV
jgi:hypothetical protein